MLSATAPRLIIQRSPLRLGGSRTSGVGGNTPQAMTRVPGSTRMPGFGARSCGSLVRCLRKQAMSDDHPALQDSVDAAQPSLLFAGRRVCPLAWLAVMRSRPETWLSVTSVASMLGRVGSA